MSTLVTRMTSISFGLRVLHPLLCVVFSSRTVKGTKQKAVSAPTYVTLYLRSVRPTSPENYVGCMASLTE